MSKFLFKHTTIIGLGLIGGSLAKSLKKHNLSQEISAFDNDETTLKLAQEQKIINNNCQNKTDLIIISCPLLNYQESFCLIENLNLDDDCLIIDLGSLKAFLKDIVPPKFHKNFIGCHPIAGSHLSGLANSDDCLFEDKKFIICDIFNIAENKITKLKNLIKNLKANICEMTAKKHDEIFAVTSHLVQFLAFLTKDFSPKNINDDFFRKAYRLDASNPNIWQEIFKLNQENIEKFYLNFFNKLEDNIILLENDELEFRPNDDQEQFDQEFLDQNFSAIFFRFLIAKSYLDSFDKEKYQDFIGSGFEDFNAISAIQNINNFNAAIKANKNQILKLFDKISL